MFPAMLITYIFGLLCMSITGTDNIGIWFHIKAACILGLTFMNILFVKWYRDFLKGSNQHSEMFFRVVNELPTILMIISVIMVVIKPS